MPIIVFFPDGVRLLKNVHQEAIFKVSGNNTEKTIQLYDLEAKGQDVNAGTEIQRVNITGVNWSGANGAVITIKRNNVIIMTLQANASNQLDFGGQLMVPDTINNTSNIVITISGGQAECQLKLHKSGYQTTIEPEQYGPYDDPTRVGPYYVDTGGGGLMFLQ
jgi:hypothetical protein